MTLREAVGLCMILTAIAVIFGPIVYTIGIIKTVGVVTSVLTIMALIVGGWYFLEWPEE